MVDVRKDRRLSPPAPFGAGRAIEPFYRAVVALRNRGFDRGKRVVDVGAPVISVGNLCVGGVGKTPMTLRFVDELLRAGHQPAIAMRGYKAGADGVSDEQAQFMEERPDVTIIAQADRIAGLAMARRNGARFDCVVLDDGFQHRFIRRDLDIVLIHAARDPFQDRCLPAGWLREPVRSLARAGAVVVTHAELVTKPTLDRLESQIRQINPEALLAVCSHVWSGVDTPDGVEPIESLRGRRVYLACGIGSPGAFIEGAKRCGAVIVGMAIGHDHMRYDARTTRKIMTDAADSDAVCVLTTGKDWTKLRPALRALPHPDNGWPCVLRPRLSLEFDKGEAELLKAAVDAVATTERAT